MFCDLDGTLIDTAQANFQAYRAALAEFNVEFPWDVFQTTWGRDSRDFLPDIAPGLTPVEIAAVRRIKADSYSEFAHLTTLNVALHRLLASIKSTTTTVLVTTAKRRSALDILAHHKLGDLFDHVVCGDDTTRSKPWPDPYLHALAISGGSAERSVTFEDSESGIESARDAGIAVIRVEFSHAD